MRSMTLQKNLRSLLIAVLAAGAFLPVVQAEQSSAPAPVRPAAGAIVGVVTNSAKLPIAGATVTAARVDGASIRATVSSSDGIYSFADLAPGEWSITVQADGFPDATVPSLQVVAGKATRHDLAINVASPSSTPLPALAASQTPEKSAPVVAAAKSSKAPSSLWSSLWESPKAKPAAPDAQSVPDALHSPDATEGVDNFTPFAFGDFTWLNGSPRNKAPVFDTKFFTPDIRFDVHYMDDLNHPKDHTIVGSTESFRSGEFQLEQVSFGGDFHWENVRARFLSMMGLFATTTPRNDASSGVGQWDLADAYRYLSEANAGYHFDVAHGLNVDAGIFVSYIGLFSYYNFDNWEYQPSFVSSNTPWFFNGLRIQWFPTAKLKIEPWIINGWQSYARANSKPGLGGQILWRPTPWFSAVFNNYGMGTDDVGAPLRSRIHTDDSFEVREYNQPDKFLDMMAMSFTGDLGCEYGGGLSCYNDKNGNAKQAFLGWMAYQRFQFAHDHYGITLGGGQLNNPGRYLTLLPPINGAGATTGSPYFTGNPGDKYHAYDATATFEYMPSQWLTFLAEMGYRHSDVPYWSGKNGITPPGGNTGSPAQYVCTNGATSAALPSASPSSPTG